MGVMAPWPLPRLRPCTGYTFSLLITNLFVNKRAFCTCSRSIVTASLPANKSGFFSARMTVVSFNVLMWGELLKWFSLFSQLSSRFFFLNKNLILLE